MRMMTESQPRRPRRRASGSATTLPRPTAGAAGPAQGARSSVAGKAPAHHRAHHVTKDYSYVRKDLLSILAVGGITIGFIVAMAFWSSSNPW